MQCVPGYEITKRHGESGSLLTTIHPVEHSKRRRIWDHGFTPAALKSYEPMLRERVAQLMDALSRRTGQRVDFAKWAAFMSLDFMGDFAYGSAFNFMEGGEDVGGIRKIIEKGVGMTGLLGTIPWVRPITTSIPTTTNALFDMAAEVVERRKAAGATRTKDLIYYLV
jgi:cytochrome P450